MTICHIPVGGAKGPDGRTSKTDLPRPFIVIVIDSSDLDYRCVMVITALGVRCARAVSWVWCARIYLFKTPGRFYTYTYGRELLSTGSYLVYNSTARSYST